MRQGSVADENAKAQRVEVVVKTGGAAVVC